MFSVSYELLYHSSPTAQRTNVILVRIIISSAFISLSKIQNPHSHKTSNLQGNLETIFNLITTFYVNYSKRSYGPPHLPLHSLRLLRSLRIPTSSWRPVSILRQPDPPGFRESVLPSISVYTVEAFIRNVQDNLTLLELRSLYFKRVQ